jgi:hypothetical protein
VGTAVSAVALAARGGRLNHGAMLHHLRCACCVSCMITSGV